MRAVFARHGESVANVEHVISNRDLPHGLTARGCRQARLLGERMLDEGVTAVYCSPIPRAHETATLVGACLGLTPVLADGLREPDRGLLEGRDDAAAWHLHDALTRRWVVEHEHAARMEGGESLIEVRLRFEAFLATLSALHAEDDTVLCITHGALLLTMLPLVLRDVHASSAGIDVVDHGATACAKHCDGQWWWSA